VQAQCSNPVGCGTIQVTVPAPPAWQSTFGNPTVALSAAQIAAGITYVVQADGTIVLNWPNALAGNTLNVEMNWPTQNYNTVPGPQPMTINTTTSAEPGTTATSSTSNVLNASPALTIDKSGPATSTPNGLVTYFVDIANSQTNPTWAQGGLAVQAVTTDLLPPGVTFVSCTASCIYDAGTNTVTWPSKSLPAPYGPYSVTYRLPANAANGDTFTNTATVTGVPLGGGPPVSATDPVTTTVFVGTPVLDADFRKTADQIVLQPGSTLSYKMGLTNTSNVPVSGVITDEIPAGFNALYMRLYDTNFQTFSPATFTVTYDDATTQVFVDPPSSLTIDLPGKVVVSVRADVPELPPGVLIQLEVAGVVTAAAGTTLHNCADSSISFPGQPAVVDTSCADVNVVPHVTYAQVSKSSKQVTPVAVGGTVDWVFSVTDDPYSGNYTPTQPELVDLVPTNLTYVDGSFAAEPTNAAACPLASDFGVSVVPNYRDGRTAVIASTAPSAGGSGSTLPRAVACKYTIATTVNDATPAGVYGGFAGGLPVDPSYRGNVLYLFDARNYMVYAQADWADIDNDGNTTESVQSAAADFSVAQSAALKVVKWVQGDQDAALIGSAEQDPTWFGSSNVGGTVDWQVQLGNSGNSPMNKLVAYDLLPSPSNKGVTGSRYADTGDVNQWVPTMTGPIAHGSEVSVSYSTNPNPCRPEMDSSASLSTIYCGGNYQQNNDWVAEGAVADWSLVRAIRFDFGNALLNGGTYYTYRWTMNVPVTLADGSPVVDGATAWNKIAASGYTDVFSATPTPLLPTEAPWVKDVIHIAAPVSVGDYVFVDVNRDGLQDATDVPVAGVTATLYAADGVTPVTVDLDGNAIVPLVTDAAGHYQFDNLPAGQYVVKFTTLPAGYSPTTSIDAVGVTDDSNGLVATSSVLAPGDADMTLDLGLVSLDLTLSKTLMTSGVVYPGSTVIFTLVPHNNGPVDALPGWSVTEVLPTGLLLVSMSGTGYTCTGVTCTSSSGLAAGANGAIITVTATVEAGILAPLHNVAYISPGPGETTETNPLVVPNTSTDTTSTSTNNDAQADVTVGVVVAVGNVAWLDVNHNGIQDATEVGLAGVTVALMHTDGSPVTDVAGNPVPPVVTDANGRYLFDNLAAGSYQISFTPPAGYLTTTQSASGSTSANDSNPDVVTGVTAPFVIAASATGDTQVAFHKLDGTHYASFYNPTVDAGYFLPVSVGDYVFVDVNRDGAQDATDIPVAGVTATLFEADGITPVTVDAQGNPIVPLVTDAAGRYEFTNLLPGGYVVKFTTIPAGYSPTISTDALGVANDSNGPAATSAVLLSGESDMTLDLGLVSLNLSLTKTLATPSPVKPGAMVVFSLVPHNDGPVDSLAGWSVTEVLPAGLTLVSMVGTGYTCAGLTCTSTTGLAAGADGAPITVTTTVAASTVTSQHNVAFVSPGPGETSETNPLVEPSGTTDTASTSTDNDAQADVAVELAVVSPPAPTTTVAPAVIRVLPVGTSLPVTGSNPTTQVATSLALLAAGFLLLALARRRDRRLVR
jgi:uncharacterized repeat protein (TIGR01451 family)